MTFCLPTPLHSSCTRCGTFAMQPPSGLLPFGLVALLWLSSSVFVEIIDAMNFILGVKDRRSF